MEVIVGFYQNLICTYKFQSLKQSGKHSHTSEEDYSIIPTHTVDSHSATVRCIDFKQRYLASGGADDKVIIYDLLTKKESQILLHHNGTVNDLQFTPDCSHLFTVSEDGTVAAIRCGSWNAENIWNKPHNGKSVTNLTIHPSGKVALTIGKDYTLRTWNLLTGTMVFTVNLKLSKAFHDVIGCVKFSPNGEYFAITISKETHIWSIKNGAIIKKIEQNSNPRSLCWIDDEKILIGLDNGNIVFDTFQSDMDSKIIEFHEKRVTAMDYINGYLATCTSDGQLTMWKVNVKKRELKELITERMGDNRPTCLKLVDWSKYNYISIEPSVVDPIVTENSSDALTDTSANFKGKIGTVTMEIDDDDMNDITTAHQDNSDNEELSKKAMDIKRKLKFVKIKKVDNNSKRINNNNNNDKLSSLGDNKTTSSVDLKSKSKKKNADDFKLSVKTEKVRHSSSKDKSTESIHGKKNLKKKVIS